MTRHFGHWSSLPALADTEFLMCPECCQIFAPGQFLGSKRRVPHGLSAGIVVPESACTGHWHPIISHKEPSIVSRIKDTKGCRVSTMWPSQSGLLSGHEQIAHGWPFLVATSDKLSIVVIDASSNKMTNHLPFSCFSIHPVGSVQYRD